MTARRSKKNKRWALVKFCFFLYVFISVFVLMWLRMAAVKLEYELAQFGKEKSLLVKESGLISAERANLYSVVKIEEIATKELGMSFPERKKIFFVKKTIGAVPYRASMKSVTTFRDALSNNYKMSQNYK